MLDDHTKKELEAQWDQFKVKMDQIDRQSRESLDRWDGPNVRHGPVGGDGQVAYENYKRKEAEYRTTQAELEQKRDSLRAEWDKLVTSKGLPPRFKE